MMYSFSSLLAQTPEPEGAARVVLAILGLLFLAFLVWSIAWVYTDAERRGKSGCLVVFLVLLSSWPISLLLWIVSRPD